MVPLGLFLIYHLYLQLYLHSGAKVYDSRINSFYESPLAIWFLVIIVYLPLLFHGIFGIKLALEAKVQPQYAYYSHLLFALQRISGIGVLLFIFAHVWNAQLAPALAGVWGGHYEHLATGFGDPSSGIITKAVYVLGILGATFHFANGINTFCMTWGITMTPVAQKRVQNLSVALFVLLAGSAFYSLAAIWGSVA